MVDDLQTNGEVSWTLEQKCQLLCLGRRSGHSITKEEDKSGQMCLIHDF